VCACVGRFRRRRRALGLKCCSIKTLAASDHNLFGCNKTIISGVLTAYELAATYGPGIIIVHCWPAHIKQIKRTQRAETPFLYCVRETIAESARTQTESRGRAKLITAAIKGLCFGELFLFSPRSILRTARQPEIFPRSFSREGASKPFTAHFARPICCEGDSERSKKTIGPSLVAF